MIIIQVPFQYQEPDLKVVTTLSAFNKQEMRPQGTGTPSLCLCQEMAGMCNGNLSYFFFLILVILWLQEIERCPILKTGNPGNTALLLL